MKKIRVLCMFGIMAICGNSAAMDQSSEVEKLVWAISMHNVDTCKIMLEKQPTLAQAKHKSYTGDMCTPLHHAVETDNFFAAGLLLRIEPALCNVATDHYNNTPLHMVRSKAMAQLLLKYRACLDAENCHGETPLNHVLFRYVNYNYDRHISLEQRCDVAHYLLKHGASSNKRTDKEYKCTLLHDAVRDKSSTTVRFLLAHNADPYARDRCRLTPLDAAICRSFQDIIGVFNDAQIFFMKDDHFYSPLKLLENAAKLFKKYLKGKDVYRKYTAENLLARLFITLQNHHSNDVKYGIIKRESGYFFENASITDLEKWVGKSAVDFVTQQLCFRCIEALSLAEHYNEGKLTSIISDYPYVLRYDKDVAFKIILSVVRNGNKEQCKWLLDQYSILDGQEKLDVSGVDERGNTLLHYAVLHGKVDAVMLLVQHGAPLMIRNALGKTARDYADKEMKNVLDCAFMEKFLVTYSYQPPYKDAKEFLKKCCDINLRDKEKRTLLFRAITECPEKCALLLKSGARVNTRDFHKNSPLSEAIEKDWGTQGLIELLLHYGAAVTKKNIKDGKCNYVRNLLKQAYKQQTCIICFKNHDKKLQIPCKRKHADFICKDCCKERTLCPVCDGNLGKYRA